MEANKPGRHHGGTLYGREADEAAEFARRNARQTGSPTTPDAKAVRPPNLVNRQFRAQRPNQLWVSDFTYVSTWQGWLYVAFVIDVFARRIVGWRVSSSMTTDFVLDALEQALYARQPEFRVFRRVTCLLRLMGSASCTERETAMSPARTSSTPSNITWFCRTSARLTSYLIGATLAAGPISARADWPERPVILLKANLKPTRRREARARFAQLPVRAGCTAVRSIRTDGYPDESAAANNYRVGVIALCVRNLAIADRRAAHSKVSRAMAHASTEHS